MSIEDHLHVERDALAKARKRIVELELMLAAAARQFRFYEAQHRQKDTREGYAKALINRQYAERCEALLLK